MALRKRSAVVRYLPTVGTILGALALWEVLALTVFSHKYIVPTPFSVAEQMWRDRVLYRANAPTTLLEAAQGYAWGNGLAIVMAVLFVAVPVAERTLLRLAMASSALPILAIGPILQSVFSGTAPKAILAALCVFFTTLVGTILGLRSVDRVSLDVVRALGGGRWSTMVKVRCRSALPSVFAALRIAAPAAILGAIVGEYLGGDQGLGVAMIVAEQSLNVSRVWGLALVTAVISGLLYALTSLIGSRLTRWARR